MYQLQTRPYPSPLLPLPPTPPLRHSRPSFTLGILQLPPLSYKHPKRKTRKRQSDLTTRLLVLTGSTLYCYELLDSDEKCLEEIVRFVGRNGTPEMCESAALLFGGLGNDDHNGDNSNGNCALFSSSFCLEEEDFSDEETQGVVVSWRKMERLVEEFMGRERRLVFRGNIRGCGVFGDGSKGKIEIRPKVVGKIERNENGRKKRLMEMEFAPEGGDGIVERVRMKKIVFWVPGYGYAYEKGKKFTKGKYGGVRLFRKWFEELTRGAHHHVVDYYHFQAVIGGSDLVRRNGEGISTVALAQDRMTEEKVAVKVIRVWNKKTKAAQCWDRAKEMEREWARNEPRLLMELNRMDMKGRHVRGLKSDNKHLCVPRVLDVFVSAEKSYLVMEYISGGTLDAYVKENGPMNEYDVALVMKGLLKALKVAHAGKIVHRDVKPEQILLRSAKDLAKGVVLCDWGLARRLSADDDYGGRDRDPSISSSASPTHPPLSYGDDDSVSPEDLDADGNYIGPLCGSVGFLAPEVVRRQAHGTPADIWAAGICLHYMVTGLCVFDNIPDADMALKIIGSLKGEPSFSSRKWRNVSRDAMNLCRKMLHADPSLRITAEEALKHPFFEQLGQSCQQECI